MPLSPPREGTSPRHRSCGLTNVRWPLSCRSATPTRALSRAGTFHCAGLGYSLAFATPEHLGAGSFSQLRVNGKAGRVFDGGANDRLTVPANAPVTQYWSAAVYGPRHPCLDPRFVMAEPLLPAHRAANERGRSQRHDPP
jgi:hypothetical protein